MKGGERNIEVVSHTKFMEPRLGVFNVYAAASTRSVAIVSHFSHDVFIMSRCFLTIFDYLTPITKGSRFINKRNDNRLNDHANA